MRSVCGVESRAYRPDERPDVLVTVEGVEYPGELRMWQQREDGSWWAQVNYRSEPGANRIDTVHADEVRPDMTEPRRATEGS